MISPRTSSANGSAGISANSSAVMSRVSVEKDMAAHLEIKELEILFYPDTAARNQMSAAPITSNPRLITALT
ncbi:hypothetical protein Pan189_40400 [Stratiformator vulcanicus]|uniref:Uncharacterized protein n=1 Tax=Stratiformator vulcanicus TaxID=2527980 RepID=A0A517R724_9PLAN|nr:hypothetical protein Pan189_40400 [Stratiformator vulcanicus]